MATRTMPILMSPRRGAVSVIGPPDDYGDDPVTPIWEPRRLFYSTPEDEQTPTVPISGARLRAAPRRAWRVHDADADTMTLPRQPPTGAVLAFRPTPDREIE